jgi:mannose-1-phosphate guanylyltransferase
MLAQTCARVKPLIPTDRHLIITVAGHAESVREQVSGIPPENVIVEPSGHGTAPCIGLMALLIHARDPDAIMISLNADHAIEDGEGFLSVLRAATCAAEDQHLVTLGIVPTYAETGYGYIQRGELLQRTNGHDVYWVRRFTEKPDLERARSFTNSGHYYWNSGIFIWKVGVILDRIREYLPELYAQLMEIRSALGSAQERAVIERVWNTVHSVSVDVGVMEKAEDVVVIPADIGWNDIGSWASVARLLPGDKDGNVVQGEHVALDCQDTLIHSSGRMVACVGLRDMVVVESGDAVLVCPKDRAQDVKKIVERLKREGKEQYL